MGGARHERRATDVLADAHERAVDRTVKNELRMLTGMPEDYPADGVEFVELDGRRSSLAVAQRTYSAAARFVDSALADRIESVGDWRKGYTAPLRDLVAAGAHSSKDALRIASDGIEALHRQLEWRRGEDVVPLDDAFTQVRDHPFGTATRRGNAPRIAEVEIPYRGEILRGDALRRQAELWMRREVIEPSCAEALDQVVAHPEWLELADVDFVLLGAASEMGPLRSLSAWGATVVAVDLCRSYLWEQISTRVDAGSGELAAPLPRASSDEDLTAAAGADLLVQAPEVAAWLAERGRPLVIGNYVYADGARFVRLAAAIDGLIEGLIRRGRVEAVAHLATPTDVFAVPSEVVAAAQHNEATARLPRVVRTATMGRLFQTNYATIVRAEDGREWGIHDALVPQQGPNYALAKNLQRWRATVAREGGLKVSSNVAPATRTRSVVKNRLLAAAYAGAGRFGIEIFEPETSSALEAALLVHDLRNPTAASSPSVELSHPYDLFVEGAAHGGLWRNAHAPRSVLPMAVLAGVKALRN